MAELIDPRVAKRGGTRTDPKASYIYPGMADASSWRRTEVHQHTRSYDCGRCGQSFTSPGAVYTHLDKRHGR